MQFVGELTSDLFGGVLKMSMVVGEERLSSVLEINDLFDGHVRAVSSGYGCIDILKLEFIKHGVWKNYSSRWDLKPQQIMAFGTVKMTLKCLKWLGFPMRWKMLMRSQKLWRQL